MAALLPTCIFFIPIDIQLHDIFIIIHALTIFQDIQFSDQHTGINRCLPVQHKFYIIQYREWCLFKLAIAIVVRRCDIWMKPTQSFRFFSAVASISCRKGTKQTHSSFMAFTLFKSRKAVSRLSAASYLLFLNTCKQKSAKVLISESTNEMCFCQRRAGIYHSNSNHCGSIFTTLGLQNPRCCQGTYYQDHFSHGAHNGIYK